jgi:hypothetical protein
MYVRLPWTVAMMMMRMRMIESFGREYYESHPMMMMIMAKMMW